MWFLNMTFDVVICNVQYSIFVSIWCMMFQCDMWCFNIVCDVMICNVQYGIFVSILYVVFQYGKVKFNSLWWTYYTCCQYFSNCENFITNVHAIRFGIW